MQAYQPRWQSWKKRENRLLVSFFFKDCLLGCVVSMTMNCSSPWLHQTGHADSQVRCITSLLASRKFFRDPVIDHIPASKCTQDSNGGGTCSLPALSEASEFVCSHLRQGAAQCRAVHAANIPVLQSPHHPGWGLVFA